MFYTYYIKADGKYYFGSRTNKSLLKSPAKDDFMVKYFSSTTDDRLKEIIRNRKYEKAGIIKEYIDKNECLKDEESLIRIFWALYGIQNSWNHYANGKFSMAGKTSPNKGKQFSEETKQKMSKARKGKPAPNKGKPHSEESKQKMSESLKGNSNFKGKKHSEETKQKIREALKGEKASFYGKQHSEETKQKIRDIHKGKPKQKFYWQTTDGKIIVMSKANAANHHPDWTIIGPVES